MKKKSIAERSLAAHKKTHGKISVTPKGKVRNMDDLSIYYTPGVGEVSRYVAKHKDKARDYTMKRNMVAVISDGSAVLGLGNIGPLGALPVMEGKAMLFKEFADVDAFPIVLDTQDTDEIVETIIRIAPGFGGINLEDFSAPRCFEIEDRVKEALNIPVMHDDQHGTAIVVLAGLINAAKVVKKDIKKMKVVVVGAGAAGTATSKLLVKYGVGDVIVTDSRGVIYKNRKGLSGYKKDLAKITNKKSIKGNLENAMMGADAVIGVSGPKLISKSDVKMMAKDSIVFALANPTPEIMPDIAREAGARVIATGRSDFPNQINNSLVFPGIFRGALDRNVKAITDEMKLNAARSLAKLLPKPTVNKIIPNIFDKKVMPAIARSIK